MRRIKNLTLIDDDPVFVYITSKIIEQSKLVEHLNVFENGLDGINFLKENSADSASLPDIILLDLSMPLMDGWQFLDEYKKLNPKLGKKIVIYVCSSSISPGDMSRAKKINSVTDYIIKPVAKEKIIDIILHCSSSKK